MNIHSRNRHRISSVLFQQYYGWLSLYYSFIYADSEGSHTLHAVEMPVISNKVCKRWYYSKKIWVDLRGDMMCAGYARGTKDACVVSEHGN